MQRPHFGELRISFCNVRFSCCPPGLGLGLARFQRGGSAGASNAELTAILSVPPAGMLPFTVSGSGCVAGAGGAP